MKEIKQCESMSPQWGDQGHSSWYSDHTVAVKDILTTSPRRKASVPRPPKEKYRSKTFSEPLLQLSTTNKPQ